MKHFTFESKTNFDDEVFEKHLEEAKKTISHENGGVSFEEVEKILNKNFNNHIGTFRKYNICQNGVLLGVLDTFIENQHNYMTIYTSPIN